MGQKEIRWENLGELGIGRPTLGLLTNVTAYRLMQFSLRHVLNSEFGKEKTDEFLYRAGELAGRQIYENLIKKAKDLTDLVTRVTSLFADLNAGLFRAERSDEERKEFTVTVSEDLDCSGLPVDGETKCVYDEGLIGGILSEFLKTEIVAKEVDCWATGARICRFEAKPR